MTSFKNSYLYEILPETFQTTDSECLSYAINRAVLKFCEYSEKTGVYSAIDNLDESVLDLLAVELDAIYYDQTWDREKKIEVVKSAILGQYKVGTTAAVEYGLGLISDDVTVTEWYDYDADPFHFKVNIENVETLSDKTVQAISLIISRTKNVRSILDGIVFTRSLSDGDVLITATADSSDTISGGTASASTGLLNGGVV